MFHARFVTCGYNLIVGVDFFENYLLFVNDITFRVLLLIMIHFICAAKVVDVKTAFLYWEIKQEIYEECPPGMNDIGKDDCIILGKFV